MNIEMSDNNYQKDNQLRNALLSPIREVSSSDTTPSTMRNILAAALTDGNENSANDTPTESRF